MSKTTFREFLGKEASLALGCTKPTVFTLGGAITRRHVPGKVLRADVVGCGPMVTGVQAVGTPETGGKTGTFLASAADIINGDADVCKEVLHNIASKDVEAVEELVRNVEFILDMDNSAGKQVYFKLTLTTDEHVVTVTFENRHHTWTRLEVDGKALVDNRRPMTEMLIPANNADWNEFTIESTYNQCKTTDISEFGRTRETVAVNKVLAQDGVDGPRGIQAARVLMDSTESGFVAPDKITHILTWTAAGANACMGGSDCPAMISTASGNQGVMAVMGSWACTEYRKCSEEDGHHAVALRLLVSTCLEYLSKEYIYMPPICSCAATSAPASVAGVVFLHGLSPKQINDILCTCMTHTADVVCDGVKPSCTFRIFTPLFDCLEAMMIAEKDIQATNVEGFVHNDTKVTVEDLYRLQHDTLHDKADVILRGVVKEQKVTH